MLNVKGKASKITMELKVKNQEVARLKEQLYQEKRSLHNLLRDYEHVVGILSKAQYTYNNIGTCITT